MNAQKILEIFKRKPAFFYIISTVYLLAIALFKWQIHPNMFTVIFLAGGVLGVYFLDLAELFFNLTPSPFRTVVFVASFVVVSLFIVSSSGSRLASGLVLSLYLTLVLRQVGEWRIRGNLNDWYRTIASPVAVNTQKQILLVFIALFVLETILFIRI